MRVHRVDGLHWFNQEYDLWLKHDLRRSANIVHCAAASTRAKYSPCILAARGSFLKYTSHLQAALHCSLRHAATCLFVADGGFFGTFQRPVSYAVIQWAQCTADYSELARKQETNNPHQSNSGEPIHAQDRETNRASGSEQVDELYIGVLRYNFLKKCVRGRRSYEGRAAWITPFRRMRQNCIDV